MDNYSFNNRANVNPMFKRGWQELEAGHYMQAESYFRSILDDDPENEEAWRGKFLAELGATDEKALCELIDERTAGVVVENSSLKYYLKYRTDKRNNDKYINIYKQGKEVLQKRKEELQRLLKPDTKGRDNFWIWATLIILGVAALLGTLIWLFMRNLGVPWIACSGAVLFIGFILWTALGGTGKKTKADKEEEKKQALTAQLQFKKTQDEITEIDRLVGVCDSMLDELQKR